jgi:hypothetical protein
LKKIPADAISPLYFQIFCKMSRQIEGAIFIGSIPAASAI